VFHVAIAAMSMELINNSTRPPVSSTTPWRPPPLVEHHQQQQHPDHHQQPQYPPRPGEFHEFFFLYIPLELKSHSPEMWVSLLCKFKCRVALPNFLLVGNKYNKIAAKIWLLFFFSKKSNAFWGSPYY
jgi:hypothetical protein